MKYKTITIAVAYACRDIGNAYRRQQATTKQGGA